MHNSVYISIPIQAIIKSPILIPARNPWIPFRFQYLLVFLIPIPPKNWVIPEFIPIPDLSITDGKIVKFNEFYYQIQ